MSKEKADYGEQFASTYDKGRTLPDRAVAEWMQELDPYLEGRRGISFVDVGAGLPLASTTIDAAFLSMVVHHIPDLNVSARELARVLKPGGYAFIRSAFSGRLEEVPWYTWFPEAKAVDEERLPSVDFVRNAFDSAGFDFVSLKGVPQTLAENFDEFVDKIGSRAISTQKLITDGEFEAGMARMRSAASTVDRDAAIVEPIDLLVLRLEQTA